jgi:hypothetical protein
MPVFATTRGECVVYTSLEDIKAIAQSVVADEHEGLEVVGVTSGEGRQRYAEIVVARSRESGPGR